MWGGTYRPFRAAYSKRADIDVVAIDRVLGGEPAELRPAERAQVVHLLRMEGLTFGEIEDRTGIPKRSAVRIMGRRS
jgi:ribosomal protein S11